MKYSRIYRISPSSQAADPAAATPDSNADEVHEDLFDRLRSAFHTQARRRIGGFDSAAEGAVLAPVLDDYRSGRANVEALGQRLAEQLRRGLEAVDGRQPWYLWFIVEAGGDDELVYLFLLQQEESHCISSQLTVAPGRSVVPGQLQFAAKVDLGEYGQQSSTCLSCLAPKNQQPVTKAWNAFIGFAEGVDRVEQTEQLLGVVERFTEALPPEQEQDYRTRVVDYCMAQSKLGEPVEMEALSRYVDEEKPEALLQFVAEQAEAPPPALYTDRNQLKRYTRFYGRDQDLSISFSTLMLGRHIVYDEASDTLTIRAIPKSLKSQLARHAKKRER